MLSIFTLDASNAKPLWCVAEDDFENWCAGQPTRIVAWARTQDFTGREGQVFLLPGEDGALAGAVLGLGSGKQKTPYPAAALGSVLPEGSYQLEAGQAIGDPVQFALGWALGTYEFGRYKSEPSKFAPPQLVVSSPDLGEEASRLAQAIFLVRDLVNTPAGDMGPQDLEAAARDLAGDHGAQISVVTGERLLEDGFAMIHAVGRAAAQAPRLIDFQWGRAEAPKVTLVGKGVCFDTGGLNLKPGNSMALMKKDMGGAAHVLGLASLIMAAKLDVRLRVLVPAVENAVSGNAFRPGDVLKARNGLTVEIGNTDAEGRLILADALALADEEAPDLLIDMATLTGAARSALGPDLPPFYTDDDALASDIGTQAEAVQDPLWRMPLWPGYASWLSSKVADVSHISDGPMAGSITAALFLKRFVKQAKSWVHFDIYAWTPRPKPGQPVGGEAQAIRALFEILKSRYT